MRSRIRRRSSSSAASPAPPPVLALLAARRLAQARRDVGSRAISTCRRASRLFAWRWKISMMTPVRSSTWTPVARSRLRAWLGEMS